MPPSAASIVANCRCCSQGCSPPASAAAIPIAAAANTLPPLPSSAVTIVANCRSSHHPSRPSTTSLPTMFAEKCVLLTEQGPMLFLIGVRGGKPMPLKFRTKWGGSCWVQASNQEGRSTSHVGTTPLQCKCSASGKIVGDATMTALPPPGVRCWPQLPAPSVALACTSHSRLAMAATLRGEALMTAAQGRASWWM